MNECTLATIIVALISTTIGIFFGINQGYSNIKRWSRKNDIPRLYRALGDDTWRFTRYDD